MVTRTDPQFEAYIDAIQQKALHMRMYEGFEKGGAKESVLVEVRVFSVCL